jgi:hypothetical protein
MRFAALLVSLGAVAAACTPPPPPELPPPDTIVRVDTITITREVAPPLPEGRAAMICLANGQNIEVRVSEAGDTLVGPARIRLMDLGPAVGFVGNYANDQGWFVSDENITFDRQAFSKFGLAESHDCRSLKIVGDFRGVNLFAEVTAASPFRILYVPVQPGVFQPYQAQVGRVRG